MLEQRVVLVTGASGGIGTEIVKRLKDDGFFVVAASRSQDVSEEIQNVLRIAYDVSNAAESRKMINSIKAKFGRLDAAVNNAGILRDSLLGMLEDSVLGEVMETNALALVRHMRDESRLMIRQKSGVIVNVSSIVGIDGNVGQVAYSASKAAVLGATVSAAKELAKFSIRVNAVAPGLIDTKMLRQTNQEKVAAMASRIPLARLGTPRDVASLVSFLVSDDSSYITGQVIRVDGGFVV